MSESDTKWAACIVYYEDEKALKELISDLLNQSLKPTEIFIADNDSIKSPELDNNSNIKIIKLSKNLGFGSAANCAIKSAIENDFEKFILFSQDVRLENNSCEEILKVLNQFNGIVFPIMINRKTNKVFSKGGTINNLTGKIKLSIDKVPNQVSWADGSCLAFTKEVFLQNKGFYEKYFMYFEDVDFCLKAKFNNFKLTHARTTVSQNPNGPNSYLRSRNSIILARRLNSSLLKISVTKRNRLGALLLFAKFRFQDSKQRILGIWDGWRLNLDK